MIIAISSCDLKHESILKYSMISAGVTAGLQGINAIYQYKKVKPILKDDFIRNSLKKIGGNSLFNALMAAFICVGINTLGKYFAGKKINKTIHIAK